MSSGFTRHQFARELWQRQSVFVEAAHFSPHTNTEKFVASFFSGSTFARRFSGCRLLPIRAEQYAHEAQRYFKNLWHRLFPIWNILGCS
jgi:hypothetical protein